MAQSLAKLQNATGSVERASAVYEALYRNSLQTGVAVSDSVDAFQRFSIAAREIGATCDQVVRLVAGLQRVAIVSGATGAEVSPPPPRNWRRPSRRACSRATSCARSLRPCRC
jgi:hypothetical protein